MKHRASRDFWECYHSLPGSVQELADRSFDLLKRDSQHPSLHFKKVNRFWSARVGLHHRALAVESGDEIVWFWIGTHAAYDALIRR